MRSFRNGSFKRDPLSDGHFPPKNKDRVPLINGPPAHHQRIISPERMFLLGDRRTNQNPAILTIGILMFRWHNVLAERFQLAYPSWSDEDVFQKARRMVIASLQNIIMYEYLPLLLGDDEPITPYSGYKPDVHPGISHVFQSAAFRFGHTMIPPGLYRRDAECNFKRTNAGYHGVRLCATWWSAEDILTQVGVEELLMGLASQIAEREDSVPCSDVRGWCPAAVPVSVCACVCPSACLHVCLLPDPQTHLRDLLLISNLPTSGEGLSFSLPFPHHLPSIPGLLFDILDRRPTLAAISVTALTQSNVPFFPSSYWTLCPCDDEGCSLLHLLCRSLP